MLLELAIRNFAIIRDLRLTFHPGLNALTGETGAGKSIIIDALSAVLGARVSADFVRTGASGAWVEAVFDVRDLAEREDFRTLLAETGVEPEDGTLILTRDISAAGRSAARINGRTVTASTLAQFGSLLVDIHGQSEHLSLLRPAIHVDLLDRYAGTLEERERFAALVHEYHQIRRQIDQIVADERERAHRMDLLRFQVEEITAAKLHPDEEAELERERLVLGNAERLARLAAETYQLLEGADDTGPAPVSGALDQIRLAAERIEELARVDATNEPLANQLREALILLEDVAHGVRVYAEEVEGDPERLAAVEDRLALLKQLKRKYGATIAEVIAYGEQAAQELHDLDTSEQRVEELRHRAAVLLRQIAEQGARLTERRRAACGELEQAVEQAIAELNMGRARFVVDLRPLTSGTVAHLPGDDGRDGPTITFDQTGLDRVEFLIAPNAGETPRPLARIASGGETARLMLALKSILSAADATPTLVFDEVDVGVGGRSGQPVGEKLWSLTGQHQVIVISHLPQIAAFAEAHYRITKDEYDGRTETRIERLDDEARIDELAAMLDGLPVTAASRQNAQEMLARIEQWKRQSGRVPATTR
ncbi:DNA repair protein RecN [Sphaerobacter thermophilus]|uniref:DNA repair protein RecN n=1 Tax=Sphaerobacter thermophilus TaxID=2057 RepID=UPI000DAF82B0|nr:MAG: DNA repair protein RecN [Sphaerobacter thermophilus]